MKNRFSTTPPRHSPTLSPKKSTPKGQKQLESDTYFCHFKNAMYMGGIKAFQKNGKGVLVHDNGASAFTSYHNDMRHGHNVIFMENCLMSIEYIKNKIAQCMIRVPSYLMLLHYNKDQQLDGKAILLDYGKRTIYYIVFRRGVMVQKKQQKEYAVINRVFDLENLEFLIGLTHAKALRFDFDKTQYISNQKSGIKFSLGFSRKGMANGLGFTLLTRPNSLDSPDTLRQTDSFYIHPIQRGFYLNSQLTGMGQKCFKNGNFYVGDFKADVFEGRGLLKNTIKNNWVHGSFEAGNMVQLIDYSNEGDNRKFQKLIQAMHQRKNSWINKEVLVENPTFFTKEIDQILENNPKTEMKSLEQRKQDVLRKIQDNFICDSPAESPLTSSRNIITYNQISREDQNGQGFNVKEFQRNFVLGGKYDYDNHEQSRENQQMQSSGTDRNDIRHIEIEQKKSTRNSRHYTNLYEAPPTKESTGRQPNRPISANKNEEAERLKGSHYYSKSNYSPGKSNISKGSAIQREETLNLDSKRLIGRSRLFKYLNKDEEQEQPPRFNYIPAK